MRILAIDGSGLVASVAVVEEEQVLAEYTLNYKKTHSQTLLPMIDEMTKMLEMDLSTLDAIAVAGGPGSFTGLRIGSATAKGLGQALGLPIISVPTVDAIAYQLYGVSDLICPIMDARRAQVYTGIYTFAGERFKVVEQQQAISVEELIGKLTAYAKPVVFLGDGVPVYQDIIRDNLTIPFHFAPPFASRQRGAALGALAVEYYKAGKWESAAAHHPEYLRMSQAERERLEKEKETDGR